MFKHTIRTRVRNLLGLYEKHQIIIHFVFTSILYCIFYLLLDIKHPSLMKFSGDIQFSIFTLATILLGFLLANLGILVSMCDKKRVQMLDYLGLMDNVYDSLFFAVVLTLLTCVFIFLTIIFQSGKLYVFIFQLELISLLQAFISFIAAFIPILKIISEFRDKDQSFDFNTSKIEKGSIE